ncbi:ArsR family transcriptional regulator [Patescibacteria group bacterium]|nr:MAG: ArsR family transcriptional regulator [Patescibacteria group bacterium]
MKDIEKILKVLANKRRLAIIKLLKNRKEANVGEIAEGIKLSFKATSRHLLQLYAVDILEKEQRSLEIFYRLSANLNHIAKYVSNFLD